MYTLQKLSWGCTGQELLSPVAQSIASNTVKAVNVLAEHPSEYGAQTFTDGIAPGCTSHSGKHPQALPFNLKT